MKLPDLPDCEFRLEDYMWCMAHDHNYHWPCGIVCDAELCPEGWR